MDTNDNHIKTRNFDFCEQLYEDMRNGVYCDITLSGEGWMFPVHRCILAANSQFFRDAFRTHCIAKTNTVSLPLTSTKTLKVIIDVMYGRFLDYTTLSYEEELFEIMDLAGHFKLRTFKKDCKEFVRDFKNHGHLGVAYSMAKYLDLDGSAQKIREHVSFGFMPDHNLAPVGGFPVIDYGLVSLELMLESLQTFEDYCAECGDEFDEHNITALEVKATRIVSFIAQHPAIGHQATKNLIKKIKFERLPFRCFDNMLKSVMSSFPHLTFGNIRRAANEVLIEIQGQIDTDRLAVAVFDNRGCSFKLGVHGPRVKEWTDVHCMVGFKVENYYFDGTVIFLAGSDYYTMFDVKTKKVSATKAFPEAYKELTVSCIALGDDNVLFAMGKDPTSLNMSLAILQLETEDCTVRSILDHSTSISNMTIRDKTIYFVSGNRCFSLSRPYSLAFAIATLSVPKLLLKQKMLLVADAKYLHVFYGFLSAQFDNQYTTVRLDPDEESNEQEKRKLNKKRFVNRSVDMQVLSCCNIDDEALIACFDRDSHELQLYKYCKEENEFKPVVFLGEQQILNIKRALRVLMGACH